MWVKTMLAKIVEGETAFVDAIVLENCVCQYTSDGVQCLSEELCWKPMCVHAAVFEKKLSGEQTSELTCQPAGPCSRRAASR